MAGEFGLPRAFRVNQRFIKIAASSMIRHYSVMRNLLVTGAIVVCGENLRAGRYDSGPRNTVNLRLLIPRNSAFGEIEGRLQA
ncbi:urocanate hydratase [Rhodopirellula rubra]|uniref:Urocanate hydratase n=1 Tax=Aporhodopirellula rubra TaxID=980271 RepID=A0A7W5DVD0_9BACT|nr:urocanate hydratase [Aporhodopirellula rubra]